MEQGRPGAAGDREEEEGPGEEVVRVSVVAVRVDWDRAGIASARHAAQRRRTVRESPAARPYVRGVVSPWCGDSKMDLPAYYPDCG